MKTAEIIKKEFFVCSECGALLPDEYQKVIENKIPEPPKPQRDSIYIQRPKQTIRKNNNKIWTYEEKIELIRLREKGFSFPEIAKVMQRTSSAVANKHSNILLGKDPFKYKPGM